MHHSKKKSRSKQKIELNHEIEQDVSLETNEENMENENSTPSGNPNFTDNPIKNKIKVRNFNWTEKQKEFFKVALHPSTRVVFVNGPAGSAKTLLSVYCGLQLLNMRVLSDIMYLRSAVESSNSHLGFLPGTAEDKLRFYNMPFLDKLDELVNAETTDKLEKEKRISMFPVNFARGMHWASKCIILDEAQNSTAKEITTVLTRMGPNSRAFILADPLQTDLRSEMVSGGFQRMFKLFGDDDSKNHGIHTFEFTEEDIQRSELVKFFVKKLKGL